MAFGRWGLQGVFFCQPVGCTVTPFRCDVDKCECGYTSYVDPAGRNLCVPDRLIEYDTVITMTGVLGSRYALKSFAQLF